MAGCADHRVRRHLQNLMRIENYGASLASLGLVAGGADHGSFFTESFDSIIGRK